MRPRPAGARQWPRRHDRAADVEREIAQNAANAVAHVFEDARPEPEADPEEARAYALEAARRLGRIASQLIDAASQAHARANELRALAMAPGMVTRSEEAA